MSEQRFPAGATPRVRIAHVGGDLTVKVWDEDALLVECDGTMGELFQEQDELVLDSCDDDLKVRVPPRTALLISRCDGDGKLGGVRQVEIEHLAGDLKLKAISEAVVLGAVAGDLELKGCTAHLTVGSVGGDLQASHVSERLVVDSISGDAKINALEGSMQLGKVGGDLHLQASLRPGSTARALVNGDAEVSLGDAPNLNFSAEVGGDVSGADTSDGPRPKRLSLRYGASEATLELSVGGDLHIEGAGRPTSHSAGVEAEFAGDWEAFGREMGDLGRELGQELGRLGRELGNEVAAAFAAKGVASSAGWAEEIAQRLETQAHRFCEQAEERAGRVERQARRAGEQAEQRARRFEQRARRAGEQARVTVKLNEREWQLDPERLERLKEQARRAAADGLSGALEAVERALSRLRVPPTSDTPPAPSTPATGQTIKIETPDGAVAQQAPAAQAASPAQEREAILRMIAEGRISPEEGDLLLEALL